MASPVGGRSRLRWTECAQAGSGGASTTVPDEDLIARFFGLVARSELAQVRNLLAQFPALANAQGPHPHWSGRPQPLHVAVESARPAMVELLLRAGADPNGRNDGYMHWSPLMGAISRRQSELERLLRRHGARVGVVEALMKGDDRTLLRLLKPGRAALPRVTPNDGSLLMFARTTRAIDRLLDLGVATDTPDAWGTTPIQALSRLGREGKPLVQHLREQGVEAGPAEFARMGDRKALERLARSSPAILREDAVLLNAVESRTHSLVRWLLAQGANPNARAGGQSAHTALHAAAWNGDLAMARLLVGAGADAMLRDRQYDATPQGWAETALEITRNRKCAAVAGWLSSVGDSGKGPGDADQPAKLSAWKPLMDAAFNGDVVAVRRLLKAGADPNILSNSTQRHRPLHRVIERKKTLPKHAGHEDVVRELLAAGADPLKRGLITRLTALALAAIDEPRFVPLLLPHVGELDLFHAAVLLDRTRVEQLLASGVSPVSADFNGVTPLHYCAASGMFRLSAARADAQRQVAEILIKAGADINAGHVYGSGPPSISVLYYAAGYQDNPGFTGWLLDHGADPADGEAVYHASDEGHAASLAVLARQVPAGVLAAQATDALTGQLRWGGVRGAPWLLAHGADPNALHAESGDAGLHAAARSGVGTATIELLLEHGARKDLRNREGLTAKEIARRAGHMKQAALL